MFSRQNKSSALKKKWKVLEHILSEICALAWRKKQRNNQYIVVFVDLITNTEMSINFR
tara:strand:+ start:150 stop:323 length:174 start_codon:yes stop_codon:yes gene_type:complete